MIKKTTCFSRYWPSSGFSSQKCTLEEWLHNARSRVSMLRSHHWAFGVEPGI